VRKDVPHGGRGAELRPVPLHRRVQVEPPRLDQAQRADRRERLAHRVRLDQAAFLPADDLGEALPHRTEPRVHLPLDLHATILA
jgi:hypothetical protein